MPGAMDGPMGGEATDPGSDQHGSAPAAKPRITTAVIMEYETDGDPVAIATSALNIGAPRPANSDQLYRSIENKLEITPIEKSKTGEEGGIELPSSKK